MSDLDWLSEMWALQAAHQRALGMDPVNMNEIQRRFAATDLVAQTHEEVTDLGRRFPTYKRHVLRMPPINPMDAAEEMADVLKCLFAWGQLVGLEPRQIVEAFHRKTSVMLSRLEGERLDLQSGTKLICVDLDDVTCDIEAWRAGVASARGNGTPAQVQAAEEAFKHDWNTRGLFADCPPVPGAPEALRQIKAAEYAIAFITARPQWQYKRLQGDTIQWLARHAVPYDLLLFSKDKCEALYEHVQPAWPRAFVEDHTRNAIALANIGVRVLLFDAPHNQGMAEHPMITRVYSWADVLKWLQI